MAEVLASYDAPVIDPTGTYRARAVGRPAENHMWEGWLEFVSIDDRATVIVGPVESRQPNRHDLLYWATGLTPVFLEGALHRAQNPLKVSVRPAEVPHSDAPAPRIVTTTRVEPGPEPVLDPFEIGSRSLSVLRQELSALNRPRLVNIIAAYAMNPRESDLSWMSDAQLITFIVTATEARLAQREKQL
jgi:hypothetical protein